MPVNRVDLSCGLLRSDLWALITFTSGLSVGLWLSRPWLFDTDICIHGAFGKFICDLFRSVGSLTIPKFEMIPLLPSSYGVWFMERIDLHVGLATVGSFTLSGRLAWGRKKFFVFRWLVDGRFVMR
ncbi:hypothetical protein VTL71DRAFT_13996 [Oculimacula yallundae]|uniref:Transmembrane protein n=1 Tax=Oculimacula yallundae TaxID=86028 RepID=A0ABR4CLZ2_9HELO